MKINDEEYELAKMAITEKYKSRGFGKILPEHCISEAVKLNAKRLILYCERKLEPAIYLYRKYGFAEIPSDHAVHYVLSDTKMEKIL